MYFGQSYEADLESATQDAKDRAQANRAAQVVVQRWLNDDDEAEDAPQESVQAPKQFRDPAELFAQVKEKRANGEL